MTWLRIHPWKNIAPPVLSCQCQFCSPTKLRIYMRAFPCGVPLASSGYCIFSEICTYVPPPMPLLCAAQHHPSTAVDCSVIKQTCSAMLLMSLLPSLICRRGYQCSIWTGPVRDGLHLPRFSPRHRHHSSTDPGGECAQLDAQCSVRADLLWGLPLC